jgi:hypothetical protein
MTNETLRELLNDEREISDSILEMVRIQRGQISHLYKITFVLIALHLVSPVLVVLFILIFVK